LRRTVSRFWVSGEHLVGAELEDDVVVVVVFEELLEADHVGVLQRLVDADLGHELRDQPLPSRGRR